MFNLAVVGAQWGDEGKGKIVDLLCERFDVVARFQGGPNAGHTVKIGEDRYVLHHVPSGVFREGVRVVIGNGMVVDPTKLLEEMDGLATAGIDLGGRLFISDRAIIILPVLKQMDAALEEAAGTGGKIGTTLRGIGPAYQSKASRVGVRVADLADRDHLESRVRNVCDGPLGRLVREAGLAVEDPSSMAATLYEQGRRLAPYVADTALLINDWMDDGANVLFEGAQGTLLDLDHGSYPYVTSSCTLTGGLCGGLGVGPSRIHGTIAVFKAYATRVGSGPMPTELDGGPEDPSGFGARLRDRGHEFGTTTGRPRRCGWFDGVAARYAHRINRFNALCVTKMDVLDDLEEIRVCTAYRLDGREIHSIPASIADAERIEPVYKSHPGWLTDTTGVRTWDDLPAPARAYLDRLGEVVGAPVALVGVGPERGQSILRCGSWLAEKIASL